MTRQVFFHRTSREHAKVILAEGFLDKYDDFAVQQNGYEWEGVWLSERPLHNDEATRFYVEGNTLLRVILPAKIDMDEYEVRHPGKPYREWMVLAEVLNSYAVVQLVEDED